MRTQVGIVGAAMYSPSAHQETRPELLHLRGVDSVVVDMRRGRASSRRSRPGSWSRPPSTCYARPASAIG